MNVTLNNPPITPFLRNFTFIEMIVLVAVGFGLFFNPDVVRPLWAWPIAPFNTCFLAAIYLGALAPVAHMYFSGHWSPARVVLRGIFTFTFIVLVVSLFYLNQFDYSYWGVWFWFGLYVSLPASGAYHLWLYRSMPTNHLSSIPRKWGFVIKTAGLSFAVYGIGLIIFPDIFSSIFPWKLDSFHSQLYSATFITGSVIMFSVANKATRAEFITVGLTEASFSVLAILGLIIVDANVKKIDWTAMNTIAWLSSLSIIAVLGFAMMVAGARMLPKDD